MNEAPLKMLNKTSLPKKKIMLPMFIVVLGHVKLTLYIKSMTSWWLVSKHLKDMFVKLDHLPKKG